MLRVFDAISPAEAARILGLSVDYTMRRADLELDTVRYHGRVYFDRRQVQALADARVARRIHGAATC